jgi:hypothetical protein
MVDEPAVQAEVTRFCRSVAAQIIMIMGDQDMSAADVAEAMGVPERTFRRWLAKMSCNTAPDSDISTIALVCYALDVRPVFSLARLPHETHLDEPNS